MTVGTGSSVTVDMGPLPSNVDGYALYAKGPGDQLPSLVKTTTSRTITYGPPGPAAPVLSLTNDDSHILAPGDYVYYTAAYVGDPRDNHLTVLSAPATITIPVTDDGGNGVSVGVDDPPPGYDGLLVYRVASDGIFVLVGGT